MTVIYIHLKGNSAQFEDLIELLLVPDGILHPKSQNNSLRFPGYSVDVRGEKSGSRF